MADTDTGSTLTGATTGINGVSERAVSTGRTNSNVGSVLVADRGLDASTVEAP
jgi:hypothetical protein